MFLTRMGRKMFKKYSLYIIALNLDTDHRKSSSNVLSNY